MPRQDQWRSAFVPPPTRSAKRGSADPKRRARTAHRHLLRGPYTAGIESRAEMARREIIIKDTHRGLYYEDGVLTKTLEAGRYPLPRHIDLGFYRTPRIDVELVDVRERELTIKGQEIL